MKGAVVVGVLLLGFLVWLWRHNPGSSENEIANWLSANGLGNLVHHPKIKVLKSLQECASLDPEWLREELGEQPYQQLKVAVSKLDLQLWLQEQELEAAFPILVNEGYTSRNQLHTMDLEKVLQISHKLSSSKQTQLFLDTLNKLLKSRPKGEPPTHGQEWAGETGRHVESDSGWMFGGGLMTFLIVFLVIAVVVVILYVIAVTIFVQIAEVIAEAIFGVMAILIGGIVTVFIGSIVAALTGGRVNVPAFRRPPALPRRPRSQSPVVSVGTVLMHTAEGISTAVGQMWGAARGFLEGLVWDRRGDRQPAPANRRRQQSPPQFSLGLVDRITGQYLETSKCRVEWNHEDDAEVGGSTVATVHLVCRNSSPYQLQTSDNFHCIVTHTASPTTISHVVEPSPPTGHESLKVSFTTRTAGHYSVDIRINGGRIGKGPFSRNYQPGPVDPSKTTFINQSQVLVLTKSIYYSMTVAPKDSFGNKATIVQEHLTAEIRRDGPQGDVINPECVVDRISPSHFELLLKVEEEGHYVGCVLYKGQRIGPPSFSIICLTETEAAEVEKNIGKKNLNIWYEAQMVERGRTKKVYCYISPKQLQVREYFWKIWPTRLFTCKVSPSSTIIFHPERGNFTLDDGYQQPLTLTCPQREVLGATFYKFMLKNIGGSEKFQDKQAFFYGELRTHHIKQNRHEITVKVDRFDLLESARHATKGFGVSEWCKKFVVQFEGEEALDWGGVSREFFELLCVECFDASNRLFRRFKDNPQGLVHPSTHRPSHLKLKHFEFAGKVVGKCLYESAVGNPMLVKARFTRSFLAQIIGLRINYQYFESDDPDLYTSKVQYIKENDVAALELVFAEEEFDDLSTGNSRVVPLLEGGEHKEVTEENKLQYLDLLAQYRLAKCTHEEIEHFIKGLNELVPDHLLSIFDENELELLMCGMGTVNFEDLKEHASINGSSMRFQEVVSWFWTIVSSFTQEEMARLLQFVTGCSQLPPGGFRELSPHFQITSSPTHGRLPTAHTCFNQLCLPNYGSCEQFQQALMIAINEGAEGFGFI